MLFNENKENQKGVAIMMAVFFVVLMSFILVQISKETLQEAIVTSQDVHELKAYYAAKAGLDISLLRIKAYQKVKAQIDGAGEMAAQYADKANIIWQFPFMWPPVAPEKSTIIVENQIKKINQDTFFKKIQFAPIIEDMGSLIDINNLDSPSKSLAESTSKLLLEIYRKKMTDDSDFAGEYNIDEIEQVIFNLTDWIDEDKEAADGGGDESSIYASRGLDNIPPNQHFKTIEELMLVEGMNQELFDVIKESITTLGSPGINVNAANQDVLSSLDARLDAEMIQELIARRQNPEHGPFNEALFKGFIEEQLGDYNDFNPSGIPILYNAVANFRVDSVGTSGKITKTIIAHVYDQTELLEAMIEGLEARDKENGQNQQTTNNNDDRNNDRDSTGAANTNNPKTKKAARQIPDGPPPVVFLKVF